MGTLLLSRRSWSVHLVGGRPGGSFHVGSEGRPTDSSTWLSMAWYAEMISGNHDAFSGSSARQRHDLVGSTKLGRLVLSRFMSCKQSSRLAVTKVAAKSYRWPTELYYIYTHRARRRGIGCATCCLAGVTRADCTRDAEPHHCCAAAATIASITYTNPPHGTHSVLAHNSRRPYWDCTRTH